MHLPAWPPLPHPTHSRPRPHPHPRSYTAPKKHSGCDVHLMMLFFHFPGTCCVHPYGLLGRPCRCPTMPHGVPSPGPGLAVHYFFFGTFSFLINSENSRIGDRFLVNSPLAVCPLSPADPMGRQAPPYEGALWHRGPCILPSWALGSRSDQSWVPCAPPTALLVEMRQPPLGAYDRRGLCSDSQEFFSELLRSSCLSQWGKLSH